MVVFEVVLRGDAREYLPFRQGHGRDKTAGSHSVLVSPAAADIDSGFAEAVEYAYNVFPKALVVAVWEADILGNRKQLLASLA